MVAVPVRSRPSTRSTDSTRRVEVARRGPDATDLVVGGDEQRLSVPCAPDRGKAARVVAALDRTLWQRLEVSGGTVSGVVVGVRHRRPVDLRVGAATALGLVEAGIPTVARFMEARS